MIINTINTQKEYLKEFEESITKDIKNDKYEQVFMYDSLTSVMITSKPKIDIPMMFKTKVLK